MQFTKVKPEELNRDDWIVSVDYGGHEEVAQITCVDNEVVWTKALVDGDEIKERYVEMKDCYKDIYRIEG